MFCDLTNFKLNNKTVAVALSGGEDSMALLHYMMSAKKKYQFNLIALNVEHGIRGEDSINDTKFVIEYCKSVNVPCLTYEVDAPRLSKKRKLSLEQAAREARYECFYDAINTKKCDLIATAHHRSDNVESVLFNLLRGTGLKGLSGINTNFNDRIIRPFISVEKDTIKSYVKKNKIPFVTDKTNLYEDYTRNYLRLKIIPQIKEIFPEMEKSIERLSDIVALEDEYMDGIAKSTVTLTENNAEIDVSTHPAIINRAILIALKNLGLKKDWTKTHANSVAGLKTANNGAKITLPQDLYAIREYDKIVITRNQPTKQTTIPFSLGTFTFNDYQLNIENTTLSINVADGLYADLKKIPKTAVIRTKKIGDSFTKFGGGTKSLNDYLTDKKIPLRLRDGLPILADKNDVLCIFGVAISEKIKVDDTTENIIKFTRENQNEKS